MDTNIMDILAKAFGDFLIVVLPVLASALAAVAVNYFRLLEQRIKNEKPDVYKILDIIVRQAVSAAEQLGLNGEIADKKAYAIKYVQDMLNAYGFDEIDVALIDAKIEAAVFDELNKTQLVTTTTTTTGDTGSRKSLASSETNTVTTTALG
jgi:LL-H family phage holin